eukprot:CAMPEP_0182531806 /NCGR_PEP_ID=MMETSP1323-20130603/10162_1 /TAXON_ID=236787 /ORGANISM="Florenciella parvula, Strain RCC1693" /LENGTH=80 /DNA_ID=CAMNT_0024741443 /DNA_START=545 /DNA_END=784 /DNA_ORIENTATION=-
MFTSCIPGVGSVDATVRPQCLAALAILELTSGKAQSRVDLPALSSPQTMTVRLLLFDMHGPMFAPSDRADAGRAGARARP